MRRTLLVVIAALAVAAPARAWTWPVDGLLLQPFAFDRTLPEAPGQHRGIDIAGERGAVVRAPAAGVVSFVGTVAANGKCVTIQTAAGWSATLTHLGSILVTQGASVAEGDGVGTIGPSGEPEWREPYVHVGIRWTAHPSGYVDPLTLLPTRLVGPAATGAASPATEPAFPPAPPPPAPPPPPASEG